MNSSTVTSITAEVKVFALVLLFFACKQEPPQHYSIDSSFDEFDRVVIQDAIEAWCPAVGYCPTKISYTERGRVFKVSNYQTKERREGSKAHNSGDNIYIDGNSEAIINPTFLWLLVAHETGHYCIDGHPVERPFIMADLVFSSETKLVIDEESASFWDCD